ncbi:MAG: phosphoribosylglycinamide formyltransferase [Sulfobacillus sp.]
MKWAVLVGGTGSNLHALLEQGIAVSLVVSHREGVGALGIARDYHVPVEVITAKTYPDRAQYDQALRYALQKYQIDAIAMAGFLRWLTPATIDVYGGRILNIHPSLLPAFPGLNAIEQAYRYGVRWTGVTVHFVDEGKDTGPVVAQLPIRIDPGDSMATVEERVHRAEHRLYPKVVEAMDKGWVALGHDGKIQWHVSQEEVAKWVSGLYSV